MEDTVEEKTLSMKALTERWHVSREWIKRHMKAGDLPYLRIGRLVRFRLVDVQEYERKRYFSGNR